VKRISFSALFGQLGNRATQISDQPTEATALPRLLDSEDGYNFVSVHGKVLGVPQSLGPVDLASEDFSAKPGVIVGDLPDVRMRAVRMNIRTAPRIPITSMLNTPANVAFYGANHPALAPLFSPNHDDEIRVLDAPHGGGLGRRRVGRLAVDDQCFSAMSGRFALARVIAPKGEDSPGVKCRAGRLDRFTRSFVNERV
jgi:hypothetical protein